MIVIKAKDGKLFLRGRRLLPLEKHVSEHTLESIRKAMKDKNKISLDELEKVLSQGEWEDLQIAVKRSEEKVKVQVYENAFPKTFAKLEYFVKGNILLTHIPIDKLKAIGKFDVGYLQLMGTLRVADMYSRKSLVKAVGEINGMEYVVMESANFFTIIMKWGINETHDMVRIVFLPKWAKFSERDLDAMKQVQMIIDDLEGKNKALADKISMSIVLSSL